MVGSATQHRINQLPEETEESMQSVVSYSAHPQMREGTNKTIINHIPLYPCALSIPIRAKLLLLLRNKLHHFYHQAE